MSRLIYWIAENFGEKTKGIYSMSSSKLRVLFVGHDNLLEHRDELNVDFLGGLGRGMGRTKSKFRKDSFGKILLIAVRVIGRKYDQVILPGALVIRSAEQKNSKIKRILAKAVIRLSYHRNFSVGMKRVTSFFIGRRPVAFFGRYSQMTVHRPFFQFFADSILFKTIAHKEYPPLSDVRVVPTNYWINIDCYPHNEIRSFEERAHDVFFSGSTAFRQRAIAPELQELALSKDVDFHWVKERLDFEDYVEKLENSKISWSPEGSNWQCWRHYEALFYGAIPLINRPHPLIYHTLVEGETCFFYDSIEEAAELMAKICSGELT